ncbi:Fur family transcriptional regulator [Xanthomonas medicagonis]|uniref:Fur family transcriptional regulator n=1 Tax=Xanthomonas medicagonis TaxID=3160841 RepID=UPI0035197B57
MIAAFGNKSQASGRYKMKHAAEAGAEIGIQASSLEQRLVARKLRPTIARISVLSALARAAPGCLDANQMYRALCRQFDSLTPGSIYKALNDLWTAGLIVRTEGARGRAFYATKPDALDAGYMTLRCHCGARLVFIEDLMLRKYLQSVAGEEGFALDAEPAFTITATCAKCRQLRKEGRRGADPVTARLRRQA